MTRSESPSRYDAALRLGTVQFTGSLLVALGGVYCLVDWANHQVMPDLSHLLIPARAALAAGVAYLAVTAAIHRRLGMALRRDDAQLGRGAVVLLVGNCLVLLAVGHAFVVGPASRALLVSLDPLVATLAMAAVVSGVLLAAVWWNAARGRRADNRHQPASRPAEAVPTLRWPWWMLQAVVSLAFLGSWLHLDRQTAIKLERTPAQVDGARAVDTGQM